MASASCLPGPLARRPGGVESARAVHVTRGAPPSPEESYCAWFGDVEGEVLYFGQAAFWDAFARSGGDPRADLATAGPQAIGRFSLEDETLLPSLPTSREPLGTGTWDVLAHPTGRIYFTTFFGTAGYVEPTSGRVKRFGSAGSGLNELALLPDGRILASRYGGAGGAPGAAVILDPEGRIELEAPLAASSGWLAAAKSVAFDPVRGEIWVTTDLLAADGRPPEHDARILDATTGRELRRIDDREVQFVSFAAGGAGALVERLGAALWLRRRPAGSREDLARSADRVLLDAAFPVQSDFAQELRHESDGAWVVTRWSGRVHWASRAGPARTVQIPRPSPPGIYYTATLRDGRLCTTFCGGVTVVCASLP